MQLQQQKRYAKLKAIKSGKARKLEALDGTTQNWFKKFNDGETDLGDNTRSGRPTRVDFVAIRKAVKTNRSVSTRPNSIFFKYQSYDIFTLLARSVGAADKCLMN